MTKKTKPHFPPPTPGWVPTRPIIQHKGRWGFFLPSGWFWPLMDQSSGPELARRQMKARYASHRLPFPGKKRRSADCQHARPDQTTMPATKTIKALTLHQPWTSLIAARLKVYETRSWATPYRGLLAIHAGKTTGVLDLEAVLTPAERAKLPGVLPSGAMVCLTHLVDVVKSETITADPEFQSSRESRLGNFAPGRYGWKLEIVKVFDPPIPARGAQGLWNWAVPVEARAGINS